MYTPLNYHQINVAAGSYTPSNDKNFNNKTFAFWERALFQRAQSVLDFEVPAEWDGKVKDFFLYCLFKYGFICISKNDEFGQFFQPCTLSGFDFYYQPTKAIIANPIYNEELEIDKQCALLKLIS